MIAQLINLVAAIGAYQLYLASLSGWSYFAALHAIRRPWRFLP